MSTGRSGESVERLVGRVGGGVTSSGNCLTGCFLTDCDDSVHLICMSLPVVSFRRLNQIGYRTKDLSHHCRGPGPPLPEVSHHDIITNHPDSKSSLTIM